jgi:20S proteasome alpha/beta subunit
MPPIMHNRSSIVKRNPYPLKHVVHSPRVERRRKMTIGIGFNCADGIVLCCDSQVTAPGNYKDRQNKLVTLRGNHRVICSCFAHLPNLAFAIYERLLQTLDSVKQFSNQAVVDKISDVTLEFRETYPEEMAQQEFLYAVSAEDKRPRFVRVAGSIVDEPEWACIGIGDSALVRFLVSTLAFLPPAFTASERYLLVGMYAVAQAKEFLDGCGKETNVVIVRKGGRIEDFSAEEMEALEEKCRNFTKEMQGAFAVIGEAFWRQRKGS